MAASVASYRTRQQTPTPVTTVHNYRAPVRFDHAFIERRFREHREWQEQQAAQDASEIIAEVATALDQVAKLRAQRDNGKRLNSKP